MAAIWPATLPEYVLQDGYQEALNQQSIESQPDTGSPKVRRRYTKEVHKFDVSIQMTQAQKATFETFYYTTLNGGSLTFDWVNPLTRVATTFRFRNPPPRYTVIGGTYVRAQFAIETA
jgi:hypothetical protein